VHYGELLDPSRYGPVTEFTEAPLREAGKRDLGRHGGRFSAETYDHHPGRRGRSVREQGTHKSVSREAGHDDKRGGSGTSRVYVGIGRKHGASAKDVADLLSRTGSVPGRLVDAIEIKDYCAFATLPDEAARRACAHSRSAPEETAVRPADDRKK
jgi:ATP-dependent RNA helicase DeaD